MNAVVVLSPLAEDDLVEIWCTVAADDIRAADDPRRIARMYIQLNADGRLFPWDERKSAANLAERGSTSNSHR